MERKVVAFLFIYTIATHVKASYHNITVEMRAPYKVD